MRTPHPVYAGTCADARRCANVMQPMKTFLKGTAMHIVCPACQKRLQIADDKIPSERQVRLTCPACHERFLYDPAHRPPDPETPPSAPPAPEPSASAASRTTPVSSPAAPIDISEAGPVPRVLVCLDNTPHRDACHQMLPALGYNTIHTPSHQAQAWGV